MQLVADAIEHIVAPALYVIDWVLFVPKATLQYKSTLAWLIFPFAYAVYSLIRLRQGARQHGDVDRRVRRALTAARPLARLGRHKSERAASVAPRQSEGGKRRMRAEPS